MSILDGFIIRFIAGNIMTFKGSTKIRLDFLQTCNNMILVGCCQSFKKLNC